MKTLKEVKEYFKKAETVRSVYGSNFVYDKSKEIIYWLSSFFIEDKNGENMCLYSGSLDEFAEILTYKTKQMKPKKEETKALYKLVKEAIEAPTSEVCQQWKDKILGACPSLKKEDELIVGNWYNVLSKTGNVLFFFSRKDDGYSKGYGFNFDNLWYSEIHFAHDFDKSFDRTYKKADPKEVESMLIKEAVKRGFKDGGYYEDIDFPAGRLKKLHFNNLEYCPEHNWLGDGCGSVIFKNGSWSKVTNTMTKEEAEAKLNAKIVD